MAGDDDDLVTAARNGDRRAVAELMAAHLPMLYRIVGRALGGHADVDDVVQETMLRAHRELPYLRAPESFRPWLVTIAMHQIGGRLRSWRQERDRTVPPVDVAEPGFADMTLLRLGLSEQRRQTVRAVAWLDADDRKLAMLWLEELAGVRTRAEVVSALGIGPAHTRVRLQRMRHRLELCRRLTAAVDADPPCPGLPPDPAPSPRTRKRLARHLRGCDRCAAAGSDLIPVDRLLLGAAPALATAGASPAAATTDPLGAGTDWFAQVTRLKVVAVVLIGAVVAAGLLLSLPDPVPRPTAVVIRPAGRPGAVVDLDNDRLVVTTGTHGTVLTMVPGFTDRKCFSLRYADGRYVRHSSFQLVLAEEEDSRLFREDATFCTRPGLTKGTVRFSSVNYPNRFIRTLDHDLRLDTGPPADSLFTLVSA